MLSCSNTAEVFPCDHSFRLFLKRSKGKILKHHVQVLRYLIFTLTLLALQGLKPNSRFLQFSPSIAIQGRSLPVPVPRARVSFRILSVHLILSLPCSRRPNAWPYGKLNIARLFKASILVFLRLNFWDFVKPVGEFSASNLICCYGDLRAVPIRPPPNRGNYLQVLKRRTNGRDTNVLFDTPFSCEEERVSY